MSERLIRQIIDNYYRVLDLDDSDDKEKRWMVERFSGDANGLTTLCYHLLDFIWRHPGVNGKLICERADLLQGTVSKVINRLIRKQLVCVQTVEQDKRGRYYKLTDSGQELAVIHAQMHRLKDKKIEAILNQFDASELVTIAAFIKKMATFEQLPL
ncbi:MAG: MarR family transcriptional regulator [Sporolactobacillus sp.]